METKNKMKKSATILGIITILSLNVIFTIFLSGCNIFDGKQVNSDLTSATISSSSKTTSDANQSNSGLNNSLNDESAVATTTIIIPSPTSYHPGGPDLINLYVNRTLITDSYKTNWIKGKDIGVFYAYPTSKGKVESLKFMDLFKLYWYKYPKADDYKIGYNVKIILNSKEIIDMNISLPKDSPKDPKAYFYQYIEIYVYDNLHRIPGPTFYHLEPKSTYPETIMTSIKLTAGTKSEDVDSIKLTAFIFKDDSDFDTASGNYIGKTSCGIDILR